MKHFILALVTLLFFPVTASAQWVAGIGYSHFTDDNDDSDLALGAIVATAGYKIETDSLFSIVPEVRAGIGIVDDSVDFGLADADVELDTYFAIGVRGQWDFEQGFYLYATPNYARVETSVSSGDTEFESEDDDWEFGFGAGAGYMFSERMGIEGSYEVLDDADVFNVALRFHF